MSSILAMTVLLVSSLSVPADAGAPGHHIAINPDYAFPLDGTVAGTQVNSAALVENANVWNGRVITFTGEAIGERMVRGKMAWIHLNDDAYMWKNIEEGAVLGGFNSGHAVWVSADLARKIRFFGDYKHEGDIIKVTGTFNAVCLEHGGDMDIHASSLEVVRTGHPVDHVVNVGRARVAVLLLALSGVLYWLNQKAKRRRV
jgi:hypothetical protein